MPKPHSTLIGSIVIGASLLLSGAEDLRTSTARADDCLSAPRSTAPNGSHWYYHLDSAKQQKCWYLRTAGPPAKPAPAQIPVASHPSAISPDVQGSTIDGVGPSLPPIRMLAVKPQPAPTETTNELVEASAEEGIAASPVRSAFPPSSTVEMNAQATGPAPAIKTDPPAVGTVKFREPTVALSVTRTDSGQSTGDVRAFNNEATNAWIGSPTTTPELFPVVALGLVVTGFLIRMVIKIAAFRRRRIIIDCSESYRINDRQEYGWEVYQKHHAEIAEPDELIEDFKRPLIPSASNYKPARPIQTYDQWPENTIVKDRALAADDDRSKRWDKLEQLRQDLDRLLRSQKPGVSWPVS